MPDRTGRIPDTEEEVVARESLQILAGRIAPRTLSCDGRTGFVATCKGDGRSRSRRFPARSGSRMGLDREGASKLRRGPEREAGEQ